MAEATSSLTAAERIDKARSASFLAIYAPMPQAIGFWGVHVLAIVGLIDLGFSWRGLAWAFGLYAVRLFFVTAAYHRYFSHRTFKTSRWFQFVLAIGAAATGQKGVLWWAAHHRDHHRLSDQPGDLHSVKQSGFWWAHMGWILARDLEATDYSRIKDFAKYPELRWLDKWWYLPVTATGVIAFAVAGWWGLIWAFAVSQVLCWHGTFTINSLSHLFGKKRYPTTDESRNNPILALLTLGEGWHNNHHHYQASCRQGFYWWEYDITYYVLRVLAVFRLVWDIRDVPAHVRDGERRGVTPAAEPAAAAPVDATSSPV